MGKCLSRNLSEELHKAVKLRKNLTCRILITLGADINAKDENGRTPLLVMATEAKGDQDVAMFKMLAEHGADLEATDASGDTALLLLLSCIDLKPKTVRCLCEHGANVNIVNGRKGVHPSHKGMSPAMVLAREGHGNILRIIIEHGADLNVETDIVKKTALMFALQYDGYDAKTDIVQMLCENGANVNVSTWKGITALDYARWDFDLVKILINNGLNLRLQGALKIKVNEDDLIKYLRAHESFTRFQTNKEVAEFWKENQLSSDLKDVVILLCEKGSVLKFIDYELNTPFTCLPLISNLQNQNTFKLVQTSGVNIQASELDGKQIPILWTELDSLEEVVKFRDEHKIVPEARSGHYTA